MAPLSIHILFFSRWFTLTLIVSEAIPSVGAGLVSTAMWLTVNTVVIFQNRTNHTHAEGWGRRQSAALLQLSRHEKTQEGS